MALQSSFFGNKREPIPARLGSVSPFSDMHHPHGSHSAHGLPAVHPGGNPVLPGGVLGGGATQRESTNARALAAAALAASAQDNPSKLTVGPNIKLTGVEITNCDTLVVEGLVEATMDSRVMQIEKKGEFDGSAKVELAVVRGIFRGNLDARKQLVIHSTGKVVGTVRYGSLVVEEGGQLMGEVHCGPATAPVEAATRFGDRTLSPVGN